jgi:hypothetical protein
MEFDRLRSLNGITMHGPLIHDAYCLNYSIPLPVLDAIILVVLSLLELEMSQYPGLRKRNHRFTSCGAARLTRRFDPDKMDRANLSAWWLEDQYVIHTFM